MLRRGLPVALAVLASMTIAGQTPKRPPVTPADIDAIANLLKIEDTRQFDEATLAKLLASSNPEVRRRAAQTIARVVSPKGSALLKSAQTDADPEVIGMVAFAYGQLKDATAVSWLADEMSGPSVPVEVAREAARSLGKMQSSEARAALVRYLTSATENTATAIVAGEALLSLGRYPRPVDLGAVVRWTRSADPEVRWRATWALFRPRDTAAFPELLRLSHDGSGDVRMWAVRGLGVPPPPPAPRGGAAAAPPATPTPPPAAPLTDADRATASARLREALRDSDRRVRTEAVRALVTYDDDASVAAVLLQVNSPDTWMSVSAVESLGRLQSRAEHVVPSLVAASAPGRPTALRLSALTPLAMLAPDKALDVAASLLKDPSVTARTSAIQQLRRRGADGQARLDAAVAADPKLRDLVTPPARTSTAAAPARTDADYRRLVEQWIVPDLAGAPAPRVVFDTPRGSVEIELYPGDAPFAVEYLLDVIRTGDIVGSEFGRVVPNFVAQERAIRSDAPRRDEVNRRGLTRGNLSWATGGLDTGRPGYTLGSTPQPHNEGDFTALGRVVRGMDVVDRIELGDAITGARRIR